MMYYKNSFVYPNSGIDINKKSFFLYATYFNIFIYYLYETFRCLTKHNHCFLTYRGHRSPQQRRRFRQDKTLFFIKNIRIKWLFKKYIVRKT